jgi:hypothetical protein
MPMKITAEMQCAGCHKTIQAKGKPFRGRRHSGVVFEDLFIFEPAYESTESFEVRIGYTYFNGDDAEDVYCSARCILKEVEKFLPKMEVDKENT